MMVLITFRVIVDNNINFSFAIVDIPGHPVKFWNEPTPQMGPSNNGSMDAAANDADETADKISVYNKSQKLNKANSSVVIVDILNKTLSAAIKSK
jgi:hypothetical protein